MPTPRFTRAVVAAAILGFEEQKRQIDAEIAKLRAMGSEDDSATDSSETVSASVERPRRKMSAATRKTMALAQQKRWAAKKAESKPEAAAAAKPAPKRKLSAAGRKRIIEASKKYWAEKRAAAKKSA